LEFLSDCPHFSFVLGCFGVFSGLSSIFCFFTIFWPVLGCFGLFEKRAQSPFLGDFFGDFGSFCFFYRFSPLWTVLDRFGPISMVFLFDISIEQA